MNNINQHSANVVRKKKRPKTTIHIIYYDALSFYLTKKSRLCSNLECDNSSNFRRKEYERAHAAYTFFSCTMSVELRLFPIRILNCNAPS